MNSDTAQILLMEEGTFLPVEHGASNEWIHYYVLLVIMRITAFSETKVQGKRVSNAATTMQGKSRQGRRIRRKTRKE